MAFGGLNYWAVLLATVASFLFGGVWYGMLGKPWLAALGKTEDEIGRAGRSLSQLFSLTILAELVMAFVLAGFIGHLGVGQVTLRNGLVSGAFAWLGFVLTTLVVNHGYQGSKWGLTLVDGGHWLGVLLIQGAIIGWLGAS